MFWQLFPFRWTKAPPQPSPESLIRRAFYRHGALTVRYWLLIMLATVAMGVIFSYPTVFMADFPPGGINGLPHHVWTGSASFESRTEKQPDLEMRQIWLRGDYMQALNRSVLQEAFKLQRELLQNYSTTASITDSIPSEWAVHSPTLFWSDSEDQLVSDQDLLQTINDYNLDAAFSNLDLRPMSVFAGKSFRKAKLIAADALVITLLSRNHAAVGAIWDASLLELATDENGPAWTVQGSANSSGHGGIYEYRFQPLTINQYWALIGAYLCMGVYTAASLVRLKAFKSRFGVVMTAITQMTTSILSSFTICGLLRINLAQIPQEAYPFVVLTIGLENIFRLINAVLAYPPQMATAQRIANGLSDTGLASVASAAQNLAILCVLSQFVSPGVASFCAFAAIALLIDFFLLGTFFVAVLSVDIRRMELSDSLSRPRALSRRRKPPERQSWVDALISGKVPFTTRMAGSAITITFVMLLNWHFSDNNVSFLGISPWSSPSTKQYMPTLGVDGVSPNNSNRTLNPASWIRLHGSSAEPAQFMHVIKPGVQSFTARIFDPVVIVVGGADRSGIPLPEDTWLSTLRELAVQHFYPSTLAVVFVVAAVTVLMNFLLWDERAEGAEADSIIDDNPLSCKTIETSHKLDIAHLSNAKCGRILSIGLDRSLSLVVTDRSSKVYTIASLELSDTIEESGMRSLDDCWPIDYLTVDNLTGNLAALCRDGTLLIGRSNEATFSRSIQTEHDLFTRSVIVFEYVVKPGRTNSESCVLLLTRDGLLLDFGPDTEAPIVADIAANEHGITTGAVLSDDSTDPRLLVITRLGSVLQYIWHPSSRTWVVMRAADLSVAPSVAAPVALEAWIRPISTLNGFMVCSKDEIQIINAQSHSVSAVLPISDAKSRSVRMLHSEPTKCVDCEGPACEVVSIAYTSTDSSLVILSYAFASELVPDGAIPICVTAGSQRCRSLTSATASKYRLTDPGKWDSTSKLCVAGIRQSRSPNTVQFAVDEPATLLQSPAAESPLRRRRRQSAAEQPFDRPEEWEAYMFTYQGFYHAVPVRDSASGDPDTQLFAHALGPVAQLGANTVGVALGNSVLVVDVHTNPDAPASLLPNSQSGSAGAWTGGGDVPGTSRNASLRRSLSRSKKIANGGGTPNVLRMSRRGRAE